MGRRPEKYNGDGTRLTPAANYRPLAALHGRQLLERRRDPFGACAVHPYVIGKERNE